MFIRKTQLLPMLFAAVIMAPPSFAVASIEVHRCSDDSLDGHKGKSAWSGGLKCSATVREVIKNWKLFAFNKENLNPIVRRIPGKDGEPEQVERKYKSPEEMAFVFIFEDKIHHGFPSFGYRDQWTTVDNAQVLKVWKAPVTPDAPCAPPAGVKFRHFCPSGCYTADQMVWFEDGPETIGLVERRNNRNLMTLTEDSTMNDLKFSPKPLVTVVSDPVPTEQTAVILRMRSGGELKVTENHPLIDSNGIMRTADSLRKGESLMRANGEADPIESIELKSLRMRTYNVVTGSFKKLEKIVVAQGYLSGDLYYQNAGADFINRMILRSESWIDEVAL